jgi:hypothetical protein
MFIINQVTLYLLIALIVVLLLRGLWNNGDFLRYPFLAAAATAGWFVPQAIGLSENDSLPEGGFALTMFVAFLSLGATVLGERVVQGRPRATAQEYDVRTLLIASIVLSVIGIAAEFLVLHSGVDETELGGQSTGIVTIYFFFIECQYYGLAIALLLLLRSFSWISLSVVAVNILSISGIIIYGGRRGPATELGLIVASAFWFQRRMLPSRMVIAAVIIVATLFVNSIGDYRRLVETINATEARLPTISELMDLDLLGKMGSEIDKGSYEVTNAIYDIAAVSKSENFDFGLVYWNFFVFKYIPAQIVGKGVKDALTANLTNNSWEVFQYDPVRGSTHTGFSDSFNSFWFLGPLVFALIAAILQRWWRDAMLGEFQAQFSYCVTISVATESVSHGTRWFFGYLPEVFLFALPIFYLARKRQPHRGPRQARENYAVWSRPRSASL